MTQTRGERRAETRRAERQAREAMMKPVKDMTDEQLDQAVALLNRRYKDVVIEVKRRQRRHGGER